jgi:hypothetical protein
MEMDFVSGELAEGLSRVFDSLRGEGKGLEPAGLVDGVRRYAATHRWAEWMLEKEAHVRDLYRLEDAAYKYYLFRYLRERGVSVKEITQRKLVRGSFFDFTEVNPFVRAVGRVVPFIVTVPYHWARMFARQFADRPFETGAKGFIFLQAWEAFRDRMIEESGYDPEAIKKLEEPKTAVQKLFPPITDPENYWRLMTPIRAEWFGGLLGDRKGNLTFDLSWFFGMIDLFRWSATSAVGDPGKATINFRRFLPMSLQGPATLISRTSPFGRKILEGGMPLEGIDDKSMLQWLIIRQAIEDELPGLLGKYWATQYRNLPEGIPPVGETALEKLFGKKISPRYRVPVAERALVAPVTGYVERRQPREEFERIKRQQEAAVREVLGALSGDSKSFARRDLSPRQFRERLALRRERMREIIGSARTTADRQKLAIKFRSALSRAKRPKVEAK